MTTPAKKPYCGTKEGTKVFHGFYRHCANRGKVQREGTWYCGVHDPEAIKAKRDAKTAARLAEWDRETAIQREWGAKNDARKALAETRIAALGVAGATPATFSGYYGTEYTGGVTLTPEATDAVLVRLEEPRACNCEQCNAHGAGACSA